VLESQKAFEQVGRDFTLGPEADYTAHECMLQAGRPKVKRQKPTQGPGQGLTTKTQSWARQRMANAQVPMTNQQGNAE
jgi:hypothetical protein